MYEHKTQKSGSHSGDSRVYTDEWRKLDQKKIVDRLSPDLKSKASQCITGSSESEMAELRINYMVPITNHRLDSNIKNLIMIVTIFFSALTLSAGASILTHIPQV